MAAERSDRMRTKILSSSRALISDDSLLWQGQGPV